MAAVSAPNHVPRSPGRPKYYESPPRRDGSWRAERPGDLTGRQPNGEGLGSQGPDQGYALKLVKQFRDDITLAEGERWEDAAAGAVLIGLKRASLFGRAPVKPDLAIAFRVWGFLDEEPDPDLVSLRRRAFERIDNAAHHYLECRRVTDSVSADVLRQTPGAIETAHAADWSSLIDTELFAAADHGHDDLD
jgi:hypothetical protein